MGKLVSRFKEQGPRRKDVGGVVRGWLHLGPEKTGTSFLQCLCVGHRELLARNGVHFPAGTAYDEGCMEKGRISAGNGRVLARLLEADDWEGVQAWLEKSIAEARDRRCTELLISSEQLLAPLARTHCFERFVDILRSCGVESISTLLILRDPVSQLLSLYKHRAKGGRAGGIQEWVESGYRLPQHLESLRDQIGTSGVELQARAYTRQAGGLEGLFFRDWLGLTEPLDSEETEVNPSLSLSELELLRCMHDRGPELVPFLHERLSALPRTDKVQGSAHEAHARAVAEKTVWQHRHEWRRWNELLPEGERLSIPRNAPEIPEWPSELGFSDRQVEELAGFIAETARLRFLARVVWRTRLRPWLGRVGRRLMGERVNG